MILLKNWIKKNKFYIAGSFFIILQILTFYKYFFLLDFSNMLWFCSHTPIIFGLAFLKKNITIIKTLISIGLIPQIIWIIDFLGKLIFGTFILGVTDYMFMEMPIFSYIIAIFEHFLSAILALFLTYKYKIKKKIFVYAFVYLLILLVLSLTLSTNANYNFTRYILEENITFPGYHFVWIFLAILILVIPTYHFQKFLYKKYGF